MIKSFWMILIIMLIGVIALPSCVQASTPELGANSVLIKTDTKLPEAIAGKVKQKLARDQKINISKIKIVDSSPATWPDGCLGLAKSDEGCIDILTPGWKVKLSDGKKNWVYRTNNNGSEIRLAPN